jgi:hypothetical protein
MLTSFFRSGVDRFRRNCVIIDGINSRVQTESSFEQETTDCPFPAAPDQNGRWNLDVRLQISQFASLSVDSRGSDETRLTIASEYMTARSESLVEM